MTSFKWRVRENMLGGNRKRKKREKKTLCFSDLIAIRWMVSVLSIHCAVLNCQYWGWSVYWLRMEGALRLECILRFECVYRPRVECVLKVQCTAGGVRTEDGECIVWALECILRVECVLRLRVCTEDEMCTDWRWSVNWGLECVLKVACVLKVECILGR